MKNFWLPNYRKLSCCSSQEICSPLEQHQPPTHFAGRYFVFCITLKLKRDCMKKYAK